MKKITNFGMHARRDAFTRRTHVVRKVLLRVACSLLSLYGAAAYALNAPTADETFSSNIVYVGGVTRLKITLHSSDATDITGVQVTDVYPAGMTNAPGNPVVGNTCSGTVTPTTNPAGFTLGGGTIPGSSNVCEIVVNVAGTQAGVGNSVDNTTSAITSSNAPPGAPASASLLVAGVPLMQAPEVTLAPLPDAITVGGVSTLMLSISNPNVQSIVGAQLLMQYPTPLHIVNVSTGALLDENVCFVETPHADPGDSKVSLPNFTIPGGSSCIYFIEVKGTTAGASTIHTGSVLSATAVAGGDATANLAVNAGSLSPTPTVQVAITPASVRVGGTAQMTITLANADANNAITGVRAEVLYGNGLANAPNALVNNSCGGFVLLHPHDNNTNDFHLLDGTIPAGGQCTVVVNVTGTQPGLTPSVPVGNIRSANATIGGFASASVAITGTPLMLAASADESFAPSTIQLGDTSHMTVTLTNPNAQAITGAQFNDYYPSGIRNAPGFNPNDIIVSNTCGGTITAEPNGSFVGLANGTIPPPPTASCTVVIKVAGTSIGQWTNPTGPILAANAMTGSTAFSGLNVEGNGSSIAAPTVSKSFADPSVLVGNSTQMKISVQNNDGATSLTGLKFTDLYPAGIKNAQNNIVVLNNCGGTLTTPQGGGSAQLDGGQIPPGESCDVILNVVGAVAGSWTNNTGVVTSDNAAPGDNASADIVVIELAPDLAIAKSHVGHFSRGQAGAVYKLIVQNAGAGPTVGPVTVADTLPQGLSLSDISGPGWNCVVNTATCTRTDALNPGSNYPAITVTVDVAANAPQNVTNTSSVSGGGETNTANNSASDPTIVDATSAIGDLTLTKFHAGNFSQGQKSAAYFLIAHNVGPTATTGMVTVSDALPQGLTAKSMSGPGWTCTLAPLNCTRSDALSPGASYPAITLTVDVDANAPPMLTNAAAASGGGETNNANDQASDPTSIDPASSGPDLTLTKSHAGNFSQGQTGAAYSLVVHNVGGAASIGTVTVTDALLPPSFIVIGMSGPGWSCTPSTKTCTRSDALPVGQDYPAITLTVFVASDAPASAINWAAVSGGGELNINNDAAADPTSIDPASATSDLTITKSHSGNFTQGQTGATYTLLVRNVGGAPTNGAVTVSDTLPPSLTATSINGGITWNCTLSPLQCTRNDVLFDGLSYPPITLTVNVAPNAPASVTNTATVSGGGETNTGNDLSNDPTTILPNGTSVPDLAIGKSHVGNFSQGQQGAVYTLLVQNVGTGPTSGQVTVIDTLPAQGLTITDMHGTNWSCTPNTKTCTRSDALATGSAYEAIQVIVDVALGAPPGVTNQASVSGGGETNTGNDNASDPTTIDPFSVGPDLTLAKSHVGNFGRGETAAAYKLTVTNAGGGPTNGTVTVTDALPQSLTIRAMEGQGWSCVSATKTCTRSDPLSAGSSYPDITLTVDVASNAPASVTNTATVGGGGENNTANDTASDLTTILAPTAGNHAPLGIGDAIQLAQGDSTSDIVGDKNVVDSVIDNDADVDSGDVMHAVQASNPAHGTLAFHVDGTFVYTNTDNVPTDSFTYKACDLFTCSAPTTVTITIGDNLDNHAPFAVGDAIEVVPHGTSDVLVGDLTPPSSVLDNDLDFDGDPLTATKLTDPAHGTIDFQANGAFSYQNDPVDPATSDSVLYEVCDSHGACDLGTVTITIGNGPPNTPPTVVDDAIQVAPGQQADTLIGDLHVPASVLDNDTDADGEPLIATKASDLVAGSGTVVFHGDGTFVYDNDPANPATTDSLLYQACDPRGACKAGLVTITITSDPMDQLPSAQNDAIEVAAHGTATTLVGSGTRLTANDTDPDPGETAMLTAHLIAAPSNGHVTINSDGTFVYVNDDPALGFDQFDYEACDPQGACDAATVVVMIDTTAPAVACLLRKQLGVVGDTVNLDLSLLFAPPAGDTLTYSATNTPPTLSIVGSLLSGTLDTSGIFVSTLKATAVTGGGTASEDVEFQVLPNGELLFHDGFDFGNPDPQCQ